MGVVVLVGAFISRDHHFRTRRTKFGHSTYFHRNPTIFNFNTAPPLFWTYRQTDSTFAGTRHPWRIRVMNSPSSMDFSIAASTTCCLEWWICCACFIQNNSIVGFEATVVNAFTLSCDHYYEIIRQNTHNKSHLTYLGTRKKSVPFSAYVTCVCVCVCVCEGGGGGVISIYDEKGNTNKF